MTNTVINSKKKADVYIRVSDPEQLKGISLEVQKDICSKWIKQNDCELVEVFVDEAKSGTKTAGRHGLDDALLHCQANNIDYLVIIDTDRFARSEMDHYLLKDILRKGGTKIVAVNQPMIDDSPEGKLMENMLIGINAFYSRLTGRKVKKSLEKKWEDGWYPGWVPYGYLNVNKGTEEHPNRIVEIDPLAGPLVAEMFKLYSTGNYSMLQLAKLMAKKGLKARKGKPLSVTSTQQMLTTTFYYGLMKWAGMEKKGNHNPLISKALFDQCQYIASKHRQFMIRQHKYTFLLRGFVHCPIHNRRLTAEWHYNLNSKKRDRIAYYHCTKPGGCKDSYIESTKLERKVARQFKKYQFSEQFTNLVIGEVKKQIAESRDNLNSIRQGLVNQKKAIEDKRDNLENLLIDGVINRDTFKRQHKQLEDNITQIDLEISGLQSKYNLNIGLIEEILALTRNIYQTYLEAPEVLRRHYLRFFFERIEFNNGKITNITETPLFSTLHKEHLLLIRQNWLPG